jgi:translation initiation factor IF-3
VTIMFRGREMIFPQVGRAVLDRVSDKLKEVAVVEKPPNMEGRFLSVILAPNHAKPLPGVEAPGPSATP